MTVTPTDSQWTVIKDITAWYKAGAASPQVYYLAGLAGVGKSTIYDIACKELNLKSRVTTALTGKAANVLRNKGVPDAMTGHSALYIPVEDEKTGQMTFQLNEMGAAASADMIGIDEASMIDEPMALDYLHFGKKILAMGDPGQLPPVGGQGYFTSREPNAFLTEIHRQAQGSPIIRAAHAVRNGKTLPRGKWGGLQVLGLNAETADLLLREDTQPIVGTHKTRRGYTQQIRRARGFDASWPLLGERVLCMRNNRDLGLYNGCQGVLMAETRAKKDGTYQLGVQMDDLERPLEKLDAYPWYFQQHFQESEQPRFYKGTEHFDWGYVLTAHKSQGSEWPDVTVIDESGAFREAQRNWLYTAITRASERLTILQRGR